MFGKVTTRNIEYNLQHLPQVIFEVTDACNLRCKYCAYADMYGGYDERENLKFPFYKAKLILDYLANIWRNNKSEDIIRPFTIGFYGGEPLLNVPFIKKVMEYADGLENIGRKIHYSMTTNAILLDKYMDFLAEKKVQLLISLDGGDAFLTIFAYSLFETFIILSLPTHIFYRKMPLIQILKGQKILMVII